MMKLNLCMLTICVVACAGPPSVGPAPADSPGERSILVLPLEPISSIEIGLVAEQDSSGLRATEVVHLAYGEGYPTEVTVRPASLLLPTCWEPSGSFEFDESDTSDQTVVVASVGSDGITLRAHGVGTATVALTGVFRTTDACDELAPETRVRLALQVRVAAVAAVSLVFPSGCTSTEEPMTLSGGSLMGRIRVESAGGLPFYPRNAASERPVAVTLTPSEGLALTTNPEQDGLASVVAVGAGAVRVDALGDTLSTIRVSTYSEVTRMEVAFPMLGMGGGGLMLEDGGVFGDSGWARTSDVIGPTLSGLYVGAGRVCAVAPSDAFVLESGTPERCRVQPYNGHGEYFGADPIGQSARLLSDGECQLVVRAPAFAQGEGLSASMAATILNVDGLIASPGR